MKLFEIYEEAINENNVWNRLSELLSQNNPIDEELSNGLRNLLSKANTLVFDKFDIKPEQRLYFIAGSSRLYLYPDLIAELNKRDSKYFPLDVGDLDMVIPNIMVNMGGREIPLWEKAGLENSGGIYKPTSDDSIEVFDEWKPQIACTGCDFSTTQGEIMRRLEFIDGYWFMNLVDVLDYKEILYRDKEIAVTNLIKDIEEKYSGKITRENRQKFLEDVADIIVDTYAPAKKIKKTQ